jgi:hypothetical protein
VTEREPGRDAARDARGAVGRVPPRPEEEPPQTEEPARFGGRVRERQGMGGPIVDAEEAGGGEESEKPPP